MISIYSSLEEFLGAAKEMGIKDDIKALLGLEVSFLEPYDDYTVINLKDVVNGVNNLLVLSKNRNLLYSERSINNRNFRLFTQIIKKKYGESTALAMLVLKETLNAYLTGFEKINAEIDSYANPKDPRVIEDTTKKLRKFTDHVEDLVNIMIALEEREVDTVHTEYVSYDYDLLLAKARHLLDRCRNHVQEMRDLRAEIELKNATELNKRIENLTDIMKKLTALTLVLMIPNIVAGHFGMNFKYMPELDIPWAYPLVIIATLTVTLGVAVYLRKRGWL